MFQRNARETARGVAVGLFRDRNRASMAIRALHELGFDRDAVGVAMRDRSEQGELIGETGSRSAGGAATGAVGGGVLGGVLGLLVGVGAIVIPGIGPVVAGGVLASTLGIAGGTAAAGAGIGAATGGILGALIGMGVPHEEARYFERGVKEGGTIVTVDAGPRVDEAREALARNGATLGSSHGQPAWAGGMDTPPRAVPVDHTLVAPRGGPVAAPWTGDERRRRHHGRRRSDR